MAYPTPNAYYFVPSCRRPTRVYKQKIKRSAESIGFSIATGHNELFSRLAIADGFYVGIVNHSEIVIGITELAVRYCISHRFPDYIPPSSINIIRPPN